MNATPGKSPGTTAFGLPSLRATAAASSPILRSSILLPKIIRASSGLLEPINWQPGINVAITQVVKRAIVAFLISDASLSACMAVVHRWPFQETTESPTVVQRASAAQQCVSVDAVVIRPSSAHYERYRLDMSALLYPGVVGTTRQS